MKGEGVLNWQELSEFVERRSKREFIAQRCDSNLYALGRSLFTAEFTK